MFLEEFIISVYCCVDDLLKRRFSLNYRTRGFSPKMSDSEVMTLEVVGEFLGIDTDKGIWCYFSTYWSHFFPHLGHRTTFARQAANLWKIKQI